MFFKINVFQKKFFSGITSVSNSLNVGPDLGPNCLNFLCVDRCSVPQTNSAFCQLREANDSF